MKAPQHLLIILKNYEIYFPPNKIIISTNIKYKAATTFSQFLASLFHNQKVNKIPLKRNIHSDNILTLKLKLLYHNRPKNIAIPIIAMTNSSR